MNENSVGAITIIHGGIVIDGSGRDRFPADIVISNDKIVSIAEHGSSRVKGADVIDASGRIVCPGFIDVHTHDDNAVLVDPHMAQKISQGVTTVIVGNCGISLAPIKDIDPPPPMNLLGAREEFRFATMAEYAEAVDAANASVNVAALVGHSTLRVGAMKDICLPANAAEINVMRERLLESLNAGAIGFSTGLWYKTNEPADIDEVASLAELLVDFDCVYTTHMRNEHERVIDSLRETFETAGRADVPVVISHHKCAGPENWGRSIETLRLIEEARSRQRVSLDAYPYAAGSTILEPEMVDPRIRTTVSWSVPYPEMAGRDLSDVAAEWKCSQQAAAQRLKPAGAIYFQMDEADVRRILAYPPTMIGSDGLPHDAHPHPRLWGTFPRVLGRFSRDEGLFSLEQAIHKMTGMSAENFRLPGRGVVAEGAYADLVIFDPDTIIDRATFENPFQPASGIDHVIVNGALSWSHGHPGLRRAGRFIHNQKSVAKRRGAN